MAEIQMDSFENAPPEHGAQIDTTDSDDIHSATPVPKEIRNRPRRWRPSQSRLAHGAFLSLFGVACAWTAWSRLPPLARDTFWAEDGPTFISNAAMHGLAAILTPYAGYLQFIPRVVAALVVAFPIWWWALLTTAASCAIAAALSVLVFWCARGVVPWIPARLFVAALTVVAPLGPVEVVGNLANLHWLFLWALFWVMLSRPKAWSSALALSAIALLGALTEIQAAIWLPLLFLHPRDRKQMTIAAGLTLGLVMQLVATAGWPRVPATHSPLTPLSSLGYGYLINAAMPLAIPQTQIGRALLSTGPLAGTIILASVMLAVVYTWYRGSRVQAIASTAAVLGSLLIYCIDVEMNPNPWYNYATLSATQLSPVRVLRYGVVPSMLLGSAFIIAVSVCATRKRSRTLPTYVAVAILTASAYLILAQLGPQPTLRAVGPAWRPQLAPSAELCSRPPFPRTVQLREAPQWTVPVECTWLDGLQTDRR